MAKAVDKRQYDVFLSHAHDDAAFAHEVRDWLESAGLAVWFDQNAMAAGQRIGSKLQEGIENSRAIIVLATPTAVKKGWVQTEFDIGWDERNRDEAFKAIVVVTGDTDIDKFGRGFSKIQLPEPVLDETHALALVRALYPPRPPIRPGRSRDIYVSLGWQPGEDELNRSVFQMAQAVGFRLIGDSRDRKSYGTDRIHEIMSTCGAFLAVLPSREATEAWASDDHPRGKNAYRYFLREADIAAEVGLPSLVIAPDHVQRTDGDDSAWVRIPQGSTEAPNFLEDHFHRLFDDWIRPADEDTIFFATDLNRDEMLNDGTLREVVQSITEMRLVTGSELYGRQTQDRIIEAISDAHVVFADLSGRNDEEANLNVAIEAGIAYSRGRHLRMMASGRTRRPPFMLQAAGQFDTYKNDLERIALIVKLASEFRRKVYYG